MSKFSDATFYLSPSGYKEGFIFPQKPLSGNGNVTFTRAGSAWRTTIEGQIEESPYNIYTYSEDYSNVNWFASGLNAFGSGSVSNTTATQDPLGGNTADYIQENTTNGTHILTNVIVGAIANNIFTVSVYAKPSERTIISFLNNGGGGGVANFNLSTGVATLVSGGISASMISVGNGWYRCVMTYVPNVTGNLNVHIRLCDASGNSSYSGTGTSGAYIWGSQIVQGSLPKNYLYTSNRQNFPRIDYSLGTGNLLLEPQRTNLFTYSSQLDDSNWNKQNCTITANSSTAPDGTLTADLVDDGTDVSTQHWFFQNPTFAYSTTYTISFYAKYVSRKYMSVNIYNGATSQYVDYDIQNGSILGSTGDVTASIINVGNGWYRVVYTRTIAASGSPNLRIALADDTGSETYTGSNKQVLIWGLQLELGNYVTTPIPTTSATVTRVADSFSRNNIYTNGLITAAGGTWFVSLLNNNSVVADLAVMGFWLGTSPGTPNQDGTLYFRQGGGVQSTGIWKYTSGAQTALYSSIPINSKVVFKWNGTTADIFVNGTKVIAATAFTQTALEYLTSTGVGRVFNIQQMALWNTPLTDAQCIELTS